MQIKCIFDDNERILCLYCNVMYATTKFSQKGKSNDKFGWISYSVYTVRLHKIRGKTNKTNNTTQTNIQHGVYPRAHEGQEVPTSYNTFNMLLIKPSVYTVRFPYHKCLWRFALHK